MGKFETIKIGDKAEITHTITKKDVEKFVELTGDDNKLHVDDAYASQTSFKKPVAHGMLGASFISTIIGTKLPGDGALWYAQNLEFLLPIRIGDELTIRAEVTQKHERMNSIEMKTEIFNKQKQVVTTGTAKVKILDQMSSPKEEKKQEKKKVALVIGATGGIGEAVCRQLAKDGFSIAAHFFSNEAKATALKNEITKTGAKAVLVQGDISKEAACKDIVEKTMRAFGVITVLVNCATIKVANTKFANLDWQEMMDHWDVNIKGNFNLLKYIVPIMENEKYGKIVYLNTQYVDQPPAELLSYVTAKSALYGFSKALAVELAPKGIQVNSVSPGMVNTELNVDVPEKTKLMTAAKTPLRRLAEPADVAGAVSSLANGHSNYLTGETIRVNGGQIML